MHAVFWFVTQPVNRVWLKNYKLGEFGSRFFNIASREEASDTDIGEWTHLRDRWEYSHMVRAVLSIIALIAIVVAVAL